jgi:hypothetical protein
MANPDNIVPIRGVRPIPLRDLDNIFRIPSARDTGGVGAPSTSPVTYDPLGDETPDPIHWPSLCAGLIFGALAGLLVIAIPAIIIARLKFGVWL